MFDKFRLFAAKSIAGSLLKESPPEMGEVAFGGPTLLFSNIKQAITTYNPTGLIRRKGYAIIDQMRIDDQIKAAMTFKKHSVISTGWEICAPEGKPDTWEPKVFIEKNLKAIPGTLNTQLIAMMSCMDYGFSTTEKIWAAEGGRIILAGLKTRLPHYMTFDMDAFGNLVLLRQNNREIPIDKFVVWTYDKEFDNPYGNSDLLAAYRAWWAKDNTYKFMMMLMERLGIPPIFALYNPSVFPASGSTMRGDLKTALKTLQAASSGIVPRPGPDDLEMWTPELADNVAKIMIPAIEMMNKDISRSLLMPGLLGLTAEQGSGSLARSRVQFDMFMLVIEKIRQDLEELVMQENIIKPLCDYNFAGLEEYPQFKFLPLSDNARTDLLTSWKEMVNIGAVHKQKSDEAHIREELQFPPRDETGKDDLTDIAATPPAGGGQAPTPTQVDKALTFAQKANGISFADIKASLDEIEAKAVTKLTEDLTAVRDSIKARLKRGYKPGNKAWVDFAIPSLSAAEKSMKTHLLAVYELGRNQALPAKKYDIGVTSADTITYLRNKANFAIKGVSDSLAMKVSLILQNAAKQGKLLGQVNMDVDALFQEYIGDPNLIQDQEQAKPYRIETIVRTNTTDAYNQGRLIEFRNPDMAQFISAVQYSAVLDNRTTEVCRFLNGKLFNLDDPALNAIVPPNHFNCRSILMPRFVDETLDVADFATPADKGKAQELAGQGFV